MMNREPNSWLLRDDLGVVLSQEVTSWASRSVRLAEAESARCSGYAYADRPSDDRSDWQLEAGFFGEVSSSGSTTREGAPGGSGSAGSNVVCFDRSVLQTPGHVLSMVMVVLWSSNLGPRGVRWRLAARIVETAHPIVERRAAGGDPESTRLLPLLRWVRWRLLSEPFREPSSGGEASGSGDERPCNVGEDGGAERVRDGVLAYSGGAFTGCKSLRRRARHSRTEWAETLLAYQDHPVLSRIDIEREGHLLVFAESGRSSLIEFGDRSGVDGRLPPIDNHFVSWYAREFFSRRFMVLDMWRTIQRRRKWVAFVLLLAAVIASIVVGGARPQNPPDPLRGEWLWSEPLWWIATCGAAAMAGAMLTLVSGVVGRKGNERFAFPFLLRFGAGTVLGSVAVVATPAVWMARISDTTTTLPSACPQDVNAAPEWVSWVILFGLLGVGFLYLVFEASIHGSAPWHTLRRAAGVWVIGVGWALIVAAAVIVVLGPTFMECFPVLLSGGGRGWAFTFVALTSLDLGIFLQVLWEDRPVTYPLGALRFTRHN